MGNVISVISVCVAVVALIFTIVKFGGERRKDTDKNKEDFIKVNLKLDQICTNLTEMRVDQKSLDNKLTEMDKQISVIHEQIRVAERRIDDLEKRS